MRPSLWLLVIFCASIKTADAQRTDNPCNSVRCGYFALCEVGKNGPQCVCNKACDRSYKPVCGSDGNSYSNPCTLRVASCEHQKAIDTIGQGRCEDLIATDTTTKGSQAAKGTQVECTSRSCAHGAKCSIENDQTKCSCDGVCPSDLLRPLCGTDGNVYNNTCLLNLATCQSNGMIQFASAVALNDKVSSFDDLKSLCGTDRLLERNLCAAARCLWGSRCKIFALLTGEPKAECVCPEVCARVGGPVCGSDGNSYKTDCHLGIARCQSGGKVTRAWRGSCDEPFDQQAESLIVENGLNKQQFGEKGMVSSTFRAVLVNCADVVEGLLNRGLYMGQLHRSCISAISAERVADRGGEGFSLKVYAHCLNDLFTLLSSNKAIMRPACLSTVETIETPLATSTGTAGGDAKDASVVCTSAGSFQIRSVLGLCMTADARTKKFAARKCNQNDIGQLFVTRKIKGIASYQIYHPQSGLCASRIRTVFGKYILKLSPCSTTNKNSQQSVVLEALNLPVKYNIVFGGRTCVKINKQKKALFLYKCNKKKFANQLWWFLPVPAAGKK